MINRLVILHTLSGLHCGSGQGLSDIDLPVARDPISGHPIVPGTTFKGCFRDTFSANNPITIAAFGKADNQGDAAGRVSFTDLRLLCLPVRSYFGTFAYVTSPYVLKKFKAELVTAGKDTGWPLVPALEPGQQPIQGSKLVGVDGVSRLRVPNQTKILLEDLDLNTDIANGDLINQWSGKLAKILFPDDAVQQTFFEERLAIVEDDILNFLCETSLPVAPHNHIGDNGIVLEGQLWFEEFVPSEAIFHGSLRITDERRQNDSTSSELDTFLTSSPVDLQIGGNASVGRGLCKAVFA